MSLKNVVFAATAALSLAAAIPATAEQLYVTDGANIVRFDSATPGTTNSVPISGFQGGDTGLVGIDTRPANQLLYGVSNSGRVYTVNPTTGALTLVGGPGAAPSGAKFGVDFNPVPDRIRFTSNTQQSIRLNPNDGTLAATDTNLSAANVVEVAYANNTPGGGFGLTTLYGIDATANTLVMIGGTNGNPSPNGGAVSVVGPLGVDPTDSAGFDISGTGNNNAFAALNVGGLTRLYTINTGSGAATLVGTIGTGSTSYVGLAAAQAPEPATMGLLAVGAGAFLARRRRPAAR